MRVLKFGGSSVADATRISAMIDIVESVLPHDDVILVCSAISGCTDSLIAMGGCTDEARRREMAAALEERHLAIVRRLFTGVERDSVEAEVRGLFRTLLGETPPEEYVTFGELLSTTIIARKFSNEPVSCGEKTRWLDSRRLIFTDTSGRVDFPGSYAAIREATADGGVRLFVAPGFIASGSDGRPTTLGRGGSDYSAAIFAAAVDASVLEIWTDVPGVMTANPKVVPSAQTISHLSYSAADRLAEGGAKVLYAPTVQPAREKGIAIMVKDTFDPSNPGTRIDSSSPSGSESWAGVTSKGAGEDSLISLVGETVLSRKSAAGRIGAALSEAGISPLGEIGGEGSLFCFKVRKIVENEAVCAIHKEFFESRATSTVSLFIAGYGAVGKALVELIGISNEKIEASTGRSIKLSGVANSRRFVIDMRGISPAGLATSLSEGVCAGDYIQAVCASAPRKSVFVDCTDDETLHLRYEELFRNGINVVTSNRRSLAVPYARYAALKAAAMENGTFFRYDTTVGTSLPILESLAGAANCSDGIESIEAVVSCTLNYVLTCHESGSESLAAILRKAQDERLSEVDPRLDLGGRDVLRKLLILAREAGVPLEEEDVRISPMLPEDFFTCPLDEFYLKLEAMEPELRARSSKLSAEGRRQRFLAYLRRDPQSPKGYSAGIEMTVVGESSPFYWVSGTENVIEVRSEYSAPLVIKGSGEGVRPAASGIIRDILI